MQMLEYVVLRLPRGVTSWEMAKRLGPQEVGAPVIETEVIPQSAIADLERDPRTVAASPVLETALIEPFASGAELEAESWGLGATGADMSSHDGAGTKVAVLDTGIAKDHPAFLGMTLTEQDFTGAGNGDVHGHGTHCAGVIFGRDCEQRIGVARGVTDALIGKVLDDQGRGTSEMTFKGIQWASEQGANVISLSLGFNVPGQIRKLIASGWPDALATSFALEAYRKSLLLFDRQISLLDARAESGLHTLVVAATGNDSQRDREARFRIAANLPAATKGVLAVGAIGRTASGFKVADFSNHSPAVVAPGVDVQSAWPSGGLKVLSGTSMACPHVAGVAALWWQALGSRATGDLVRSKIEANARFDDFAPGYDHTDVGSGLVRAP